MLYPGSVKNESTFFQVLTLNQILVSVEVGFDWDLYLEAYGM